MNWDIVFDVCILLWVILLQVQSYDTRRNCDIDRLDKQDIAEAVEGISKMVLPNGDIIKSLKKKVKSRKSKK